MQVAAERNDRMELIRLQKIIADSGYCSRRKAEEYISRGKVKVIKNKTEELL